ncbi:MAG: glycine--tRNA ligase subunit beta [Janthinobacterium lividum]
MPELLIELFGEEIPARMQARGAAELARLVGEALAPLSPEGATTFYGPRRIALRVAVRAGVEAQSSVERGPRASAPEQALAGFLRKHGAGRGDLREEGGFWVLERAVPGVSAAEMVAAAMPGLLRRFAWPKSMRWGAGSAFAWVRPLRRILCLLDGAVVPFDLASEGDDGHGLQSGALTEGHRFMAPGAVEVGGAEAWLAALRARFVEPDAAVRRGLVAQGVAEAASARGLVVVEEAGLLDEVAGLVEWPVALLGRIGAEFMDLPAEVMQVSMRVNQRYFALRDGEGRAAPFFGFAANIVAADGGAAIVAGNERVLRARFSDARHFWDADRRVRLEDRVAALDGVTFHARLGSQGARVARIVALAGAVSDALAGEAAASVRLVARKRAERAALLCKADLTTGMVGEFPELQGVMGGYYARHDGEDPRVADGVRDHYLPKGPGDAVPREPVAVAVALADKLDQLVAFFLIGERPGGSGDPFALRRAALGVIRIIRENGLRLELGIVLRAANALWSGGAGPEGTPLLVDEVTGFLLERLRVQLRAEGERHDVLSAVLGAGRDDDVTRVLARTAAVAGLLGGEGGTDLLAAYRRAANILRIEDKRDGPHGGAPDPARLVQGEEVALHEALERAAPEIAAALGAERYGDAMAAMGGLRPPLDAFFAAVTVNDADTSLRQNRLRLLAWLRDTMNRVADFSAIEG